METGFRGTFVISWSQTYTDGEEAAEPVTLGVGSAWRWTGQVVRIDGPNELLRLEGAHGTGNLRSKAARTVRKLVGAATSGRTDVHNIEADEPLKEQCFVVTDGRRAYVVTLIDAPNARPLAMFVDEIPPRDTDLWVVEHTMQPNPAGSPEDGMGQVICFTPGTQIRMAKGACDVADLKAGDWVQTKDNGMQQVMWTGQRRISGARLHVMPHLAPIRMRSGALGRGRPDQELLVSPEHRMLVQGAAARDLFSCDEVLVGARDLVNGRDIFIDHRVREVTYVHVLFERHEVVWANGLETESFHPAQAALDDAQLDSLSSAMPGFVEGGRRYSDYARRVLSPTEAAILGHAA